MKKKNLSAAKKRTGTSSLLILLATLFVNVQIYGQAQQATGGVGTNKDIFWLTWGGLNLGAGQTVTRTFTIGTLTVTTIIDQVSFSGTPGSGQPLSAVRLSAYRPGSWTGDGLDDLYNIGGTGAANTLVNAISTNFTGSGTAPGLTASFRIRAYATGAAGTPIDLSLVFANGEDDGPAGTSIEYEQLSTNGTPWKLLERAAPTTAGFRQITFSSNNTTAQISCGSGNVALMYTSVANTSSSAPLTSNVQFLSWGKSAIALGLIINSDFGDAPASYGTAQNNFQPIVANGDPSQTSGNFINYLSSGTRGGTPVIDPGTKQNPTSPRMGPLAADNEATTFNTAIANGDDINGVDDEDAFSSVSAGLLSNPTLNVPVFKNTAAVATPIYVYGWIDFNKNGIFEVSELATGNFVTNNTNTTVQLTWNLSGVANKNAGASYARFRISSNDPLSIADNPGTSIDERSTFIMDDGETEDYTALLTATDIITGTVFLDGNGLSDNIINGIGTNAGGLNAILVDASGNVASNVPVNADGTYSFSDIANGSYSVRISTTAGAVGAPAPASALPAGWGNTGEGTTAAGDGTANGIVNNIVIDNATPITNVNFGIEQKPVAQAVTYALPTQPRSGVAIPLNGSENNPPGPNGSDAEDGTLGGMSTTSTFVLTTQPDNGILYYDSGSGPQPLSTDIPIANFNASKLSLTPTAQGSTSIMFQYTFFDKAGVRGDPVSYAISWDKPLPVVFGKISATITDDHTLHLLFETLSETGNAYYDIEASTDGINFTKIGTISAKGSGDSSEIQQYEFHKVLGQNLVLGLSVLGLLGCSLLLKRSNNNYLFALVLTISLCLGSLGCKKNTDTLKTADKQLFIRIVQIDKDGTKNYSPVLKAVQK